MAATAATPHLALAALHAKHEELSKPAEEAREDSRLHWAADTKPCQRYSSGNNNSTHHACDSRKCLSVAATLTASRVTEERVRF